MEIIHKTIPTGTIEGFAETHDLVMMITERPVDMISSMRYCARFVGCEVIKGSCLHGMTGNGSTPEEAVACYARQISMARLALGAYRHNRHDITVWRLLPTEGD